MTRDTRDPVLHGMDPTIGCRTVIPIEVTNEQSRVPVDEERLRAAVSAVLTDAFALPPARGNISIAVVDDATIHELNRRFLAHDYPTDVLSFLLEEGGNLIEGEIIVSADTAATAAAKFGWSAENELLLYVIHGALHLVGYDDQSPADAALMRAQEARHLARFGLQLPAPPAGPTSAASPSCRSALAEEGSSP